MAPGNTAAAISRMGHARDECRKIDRLSAVFT